MGPRRARALLALAAALLALASFSHAAISDGQQGTGGKGQQDSAAPLASPPAPPPLLHSTACQLAGSWCPVHEQDASAQLLGWGGNNRGSLGAAATNRSGGGTGSQPARADGSAQPRAQAQQHKPLWPLSSWDVAGIGAAALALLLAASGGIGGGGILVPVYLMILGGFAGWAQPAPPAHSLAPACPAGPGPVPACLLPSDVPHSS